MGRHKENFIEQGAVGLIILAVIIYMAITLLFWLVVIWMACLLVWLTYFITTEFEWFEERLWAKITAFLLIFALIVFGGSEVLANYGKIDKSFRQAAIETAQNFKLYKSNRGNFKVEPNVENILMK